jgi:hypothetical protein
MNIPQASEPPRNTRAGALVAEMRRHPYRAWLESRPAAIVGLLAVVLGLPLCQLPGGRPYTTAELIDMILAAEWERTRK